MIDRNNFVTHLECSLTGKTYEKNKIHGNYYDGNWNKDKMTGRGKFHWAKDGGSYEGLFKDGQIVNIEIAVTVDTPEKDAK